MIPDMEDATLLYTFSTIPQVLGAVVAVVAALVIIRIQRLSDYLVGDGKATLARWEEDDTGYRLKVATKFQHARLRDGILRKSVPEIQAVLHELSRQEKNEGYTKKQRPRGLQYLYEDRFLGTLDQIDALRKMTWCLVLLSFVVIVFTLVALPFNTALLGTIWREVILWTGLSLFCLSIGATLRLLAKALFATTLHERDRQVDRLR
jgi:hypothetical protein